MSKVNFTNQYNKICRIKNTIDRLKFLFIIVSQLCYEINQRSNMLFRFKICLLPLLFIFSILFGDEAKKTICVNMIVKNETKVIQRCLGSVKPIIDYWVIVDTGSTDGTQELIKAFMKEVPGELHERPWKNFAHNRNEALQLAKGKADYVLIIDADEVLRMDPEFKLPKLEKDLYYITTEAGGLRYERAQLINNSLDWKWVGVLHEVLCCDNLKSSEILKHIANVPYPDGARSQDPRKYHKDAELLETAMLDDPNNTRNQFYLAQSYRDAGDYETSLKNYEKRIAMGGWDQELFWSMLQVARLEQILKRPEDIIVNDYYKAYHFRPNRAEPLYNLANYYRLAGNFVQAFQIAKKGLTIPLPNDLLFIEKYVYDYGMLLEYSVSAYYIGKYEASKKASEQILAKKDIPEDIRALVQTNINWAEKGLAKKALTQRLLDKPTPIALN